MDYQDTQKGNIVKQIKEAMLAGYPVIHIPTANKELINDIIFNDNESYSSFVPRLYIDRAGNPQFHELGGKKEICPNSLCGYRVVTGDENILKIKTPMIFIHYLDSFNKKNELDLVKNFLALYYDTQEVTNYQEVKIPNSNGAKREINQTKRISELIRRSLFIIVTPSREKLPKVIAPYTRVIDINVLSDNEIINLIEQQLKKARIPSKVLTDKAELFNKVKVSFRGFSHLLIIQLMNLMIRNGNIDTDRIDENGITRIINDAKKQMLSNTQGLKWEKTDSSDAAGMGVAVQWFQDKSGLFKDPKKAAERHLDIPNAAIITGVPGAGKSLMAKMIARIFDAPLISFDMGAIRDKYQGESEHNMMEALRMAEQMAPCVLWIDEIEKAFNSSSNGEDSLGIRLFGKFLTWMQEKSSACFVFATSNDVTKLPPELFRSERFDRKYFAFMPTAQECAEIFVSNLSKQQSDYKNMRDQMKREERNNIPKQLFDEDLLKLETWLNLLNSDRRQEIINSNLIEKKNKRPNGENTISMQWEQRPSNKLFTGADITAIIKEAKFYASKIANDNPVQNNESVYSRDVFLEQAKRAISEIKPYGQTNLRDIAKCYYLLYINQFESASKNNILRFESFNEDDLIYTPNENENLIHEYDKSLYNTIVGAINKYLPQIIEHQTIKR